MRPPILPLVIAALFTTATGCDAPDAPDASWRSSSTSLDVEACGDETGEDLGCETFGSGSTSAVADASSGGDASGTAGASSSSATGASTSGDEAGTTGSTTADSGDTPAVSFASDVWPIIAARCSCHQGSNGAAGLVMSSSDVAYDNLVGVVSTRTEGATRVVPFEASSSVLWSRVSSTMIGYRMPLAGAALTSEQQATIRSWIDGGAQP